MIYDLTESWQEFGKGVGQKGSFSVLIPVFTLLLANCFSSLNQTCTPMDNSLGAELPTTIHTLDGVS